MKRRFIAFILVVLILLPLTPKPVNAKGLVKGIDVLMDDFKLQVESQYISHKEVFFYKGDIWVPINDLGRSLGLNISYNSSKRTLDMNSNGRLAFSDNSLEPISYQRGYEILSKERLIDHINDEIRDFLYTSRSSTNSRVSDLKSITVGFSDIEIKLDGNKINLQQDPLLYNDDVYMALTSLSPYLYITPTLSRNLIDIDSNGILRDKPYYSIDALVAFRESLNDRYSRELNELNKKREILMDVKIPYEEISSLRDMERYLNRYLDEIGDLSVDVNLRSASGNWYYVDIEFPNRRDYKWRDLSRREVEAYIWDIYVAIESLYDEDARIQGSIEDFVTFDTKMRNIVFSFIDSELDIATKLDPVFIEELLDDKLDRYRREYFNYDVRVSGYDLELIVTAESSRFLEKWSPWQQVDFIENINYEIKKYYPGIKVNGKVVYRDSDPLFFVIEDNKVRSSTIIDNTEDYLQDRFETLYANELRIPMKYSLNQTDIDNFNLIVDMDFLISDSRWNREAEDDLGILMDDVLRYIVDIWDANIFVQVYDKSQTLVYEYIVSQDTVQMVRATPSSGEIVEGSSVSLSTSTLDADIYFTLDGSMPSTNSQRYTDPIVISTDTTIKAFAQRSGFKDSPTATFHYTVIDDSNMASGLDDLLVKGFKINPSFSKNQSNYTVDVPYGSDSVSIIAKASVGDIAIDGDNVSSKQVSIDSDSTTIKIVHSEDGKSKDRVYTIIVNLEDKVESDVELDPDYSLNIFGFGSFSGRLTGDSSAYTVRLLSGMGKEYDSVTVDSDGSFEISGFPVDAVANILGYKYEIRDPDDKYIASGTLKAQ